MNGRAEIFEMPEDSDCGSWGSVLNFLVEWLLSAKEKIAKYR